MSNVDNEAKDYYHQTDPQYKLRWPLELKEKIAQSAKEHNRSMNADIVARLQDSLLTLPRSSLKRELHFIETEELVSELMRRYDNAELLLSIKRKEFDD